MRNAPERAKRRKGGAIMTAQPKRKHDIDVDADAEKPRVDRKQEEKMLDKALEDSFPGSDPVSITQPVPEPNRSEKERNAKKQ
jgi:hypothetical protein